MRILTSNPRQDGYYMPAEYDEHYGCLMIWPERTDSWQYGAFKARKAFVQVAAAIAETEEVTVCVSEAQYDNAREHLPYYIRVVEMSSNDSWARDYAPTFLVNQVGNLRGIDWGFNAWGGLYDGLYYPWDKDNKMARKLCDLYHADCYNARDFVFEGGAVHVDGEGTAIVTKVCLLSKGRNPDMSIDEIEEMLKKYLNITKIIWLERGIYNDETNEHVDNICSFTAPSRVVLAWTDDETDPQYELSMSCFNILSEAVDAKGRKIAITKMPIPSPVCITEEECEGLEHMDGKPVRTPGERLAASYVNFYIANDKVIVPGFNDPMDEIAVNILKEAFPGRKIEQIYARDILIGGGNIHCITQQIPKHSSMNAERLIIEYENS